MSKPKALILTGYGINCEEETAKSFAQAGAIPKVVHINDLIDNPKSLNNYQILAYPGGFSYADDTGAGNALANKLKNNLQEEIFNFAKQDKLIIGICNGFQMLANTGLAPATNNQYGKREVALMHNKTARLECRWIHLKNTSKKCVWTKGIDVIHLPIAHGEGNFYTDQKTLSHMQTNNQIVFKYVKPDGSPAASIYPFNPNGALEDIAGICDESGRILGMMPHPERFTSFTNNYDWPLLKEELIRQNLPIPKEGEGLKIFKNAVKYFQ
ncbi:MAG: phosphoribosylformylglycinamidine synthase I [Candidatus Peregrinibacteria bacterium]